MAARGAADLALASDRLVTQLTRYRETAVLMSDHPVLMALAEGGDRGDAEALLLETVDKTSARAAYYAAPDGQVLASVSGPVPEDLAARPFFLRALDGALGAARDESSDPAARSFSFAAPSFGPGGRVLGVLVVVVDVARLEQDWRGAWPTVWFTDAGGEVFITNRSEMLGAQRVPEGLLESCSKPDEFKKILFGLCFMHAVMGARRLHGVRGWAVPYQWGAKKALTLS